MKRFAIVEDDPKDASALLDHFAQYQNETGLVYEAVWFADPVEFLEKYTSRFDVVFMDIDMKHMDGMRTSRKLREMDENIILVFVTNLKQYAVDGYEVNATDFIVKPVQYAQFRMKLKRILGVADRDVGVRLQLHTAKGEVVLAAQDIFYIEVFDETLIYHTRTGKIESPGTLSGAEKSLPAFSFFRCNRCYLINLRYVTAVREGTVIVGGDELQISRRRHHDLLAALNEYISGGS